MFEKQYCEKTWRKGIKTNCDVQKCLEFFCLVNNKFWLIIKF